MGPARNSGVDALFRGLTFVMAAESRAINLQLRTRELSCIYVQL